MKYFSPPLIVFITGHPATGKTTIGRRLAKEIGLPFLCRDDIKETLYDCLGWSDREWAKKLGYASYELLYQFMELQLSGGYSYVVETNVDPVYANPRIKTLKKRYPFESLQIPENCFEEKKESELYHLNLRVCVIVSGLKSDSALNISAKIFIPPAMCTNKGFKLSGFSLGKLTLYDLPSSLIVKGMPRMQSPNR
ncbi:MAG: AAA family ATPase [Candidatus Hermodarchaeota archaeon]